MVIYGEKGETVTFQLFSKQDYASDNVRVSFSLNCRWFKAQGAFTFPQTELAQFLTQLRSLEEMRQGEALLKTPPHFNEFDAFQFKLCSIDKLGHLAVYVEFTEFNTMRGKIVPTKLDASFEVEPSSLPTIVRDFYELIELYQKQKSEQR